MSFKITSTVFQDQSQIPEKYTCDGADISPPLAWEQVPDSCKSLVLIMDDPDAPDPAAPRRTWDHWILYNVPPTRTHVPEAFAVDSDTTIRSGLNSWQRTSYGGPCPPIGNHRYFFKLYVLDVILPDLGEPAKSELEAAMAGHILVQATLIGKYQH